MAPITFAAMGPRVVVPPPATAPSTNLWSWWSADQSYTETSGTPTTLITVDGTAIGSQLDRSGNGRHIYQTVTLPVFKTNVLNSLPGARYIAGTSMATNAVQPSGNSFTIYAVVNRTASNNFASIVTNDDATLSPRYLIVDNGSGGLRIFNGGYNTAVAMSSTTYHLVAASIDNTGSFPVNLKIDNGADNTENVTGGGNLGASHVTIGFFNGVSWVGDIVEILFYTAVHSFGSGDGLLARQYLNNRYALGLGI